MEKKNQGSIESSCYAVMHFLGSATKTIRNSFGFKDPQGKYAAGASRVSDKAIPAESGSRTQEQLSLSVQKLSSSPATITKDPLDSPLPESAVEPEQEESSFQSQDKEAVQVHPIAIESKEVGKEIEDLFSGIEFESELERMKAEVFVEDFRSQLNENRAKTLRRLREISRPSAAALLKKLLPLETDPLQIIEILNELISLNSEAKVEKDIFTGFLKHPNPLLRQTAVRGVARYKDEEGFSIITLSLQDRNAKVRKEALNCISWFFSDRCSSAVLKSLHDIDHQVKNTAILLCGAIKLRQSISTLITLLGEPDQEIQKNAVTSLRKITGQSFGFKVTGSKRNKKAAIEDWSFWWRQNQAQFV
jgi:hypothetical protein